MKYNTVLSIAGADNSGGAGIQADIKSVSACGCYAMTALTAVAVQNTQGVTDVFALPVKVLEEQIESCLSDIGADAVKIGMLHSSEVINVVKDAIVKYVIKNVVLDPVMVSTSGHKLIEDEAIATLKSVLISKARIITPNIPEAEILLGKKISQQSQLPALARELSAMYSTCGNKVSVFLKAGHLVDDDLIDVFYNAETDEAINLKSKRVYTKNTHGTGCTLSSALASFLAKGLPLNDAARSAKDYINGAIVAGKDYQIGHGFGPVCHFWNLWK